MPENLLDEWRARVELSKDERPRWEAQVATCMSFDEGNHRVWYNDQGQQIRYEIQDNEIFRTINLIPGALSIITTRLTANNPRWNPKKSGLENVTRDEVMAADAILQDVWEGEEFGEYAMEDEMKLVIRNGFLQGGGLAYIRYDEERQMPVVESYSLWDTFSDPTAQRLVDKRWLDIVLSEGIEGLKANENTDNKKLLNSLMADHIIAESREQQFHIRNTTGMTTNKFDTVQAHNTFAVEDKNIVYRKMVNSDVPGIDGEEGVIEKQVIEPPEGISRMRLSHIFDVYHPVVRGRFYERPVVMNWIDPQKSVNKTYSDIESYIVNFLQGKWIISDENTQVPVAGMKGQIIHAEPGEIQQLEMKPLPSTHFEHQDRAVTHFERMSGVHSESMGRISGGAESGVAIAQLQALDEQNSADPVHNFKRFLSRVGSKVLLQASMNWDTTRNIYKYDKFSESESPIKVVGELARPSEISKSTVKIRPFRRLDVEIVIGQFFQQSQKREEIRNLLSWWQPGVNPVVDKIVVDSQDIGVGREVVDELKKLENPEEMIAYGKSLKLSRGERVIVNASDPHAYLQGFYAKRAEEALENGDQNGARVLNAQAQQHSTFIQEGVGGVGSPDAVAL